MNYLCNGALTGLLLFAVASPVLGESAEEKGLRVIKSSEDYHAGYKDYSANGTMVLEDATGQKSERLLSSKVLEGIGDLGDRVLMIFSTPKDIKGTALLSWANLTKTEDQWLYLPALKRVKRIASSNKTGPFMGSEFSYEDLTPRQIEKYTYKYSKRRKCGKLTCDVIIAFPTDKKSGYSRQLVFLDTKEKRLQIIKFFDRKKSHLKTMTFSKYRKHKKKHWAASKVHMKNLQSKKTSYFLWSDFKFDAGLNKRNFEKNAMKRAR